MQRISLGKAGKGGSLEGGRGGYSGQIMWGRRSESAVSRGSIAQKHYFMAKSFQRCVKWRPKAQTNSDYIVDFPKCIIFIFHTVPYSQIYLIKILTRFNINIAVSSELSQTKTQSSWSSQAEADQRLRRFTGRVPLSHPVVPPVPRVPPVPPRPPSPTSHASSTY